MTGHSARVCRQKKSKEDKKGHKTKQLSTEDVPEDRDDQYTEATNSLNMFQLNDSSQNIGGKNGPVAPSARRGMTVKKRDIRHCQRESTRKQKERFVDTGSDSCQDSEEDPYNIYCCAVQREDPIFVKPKLNDIPMKMEVDTGASLTVMGRKTFKRCFKKVSLEPTDIKLRTYTGEST